MYFKTKNSLFKSNSISLLLLVSLSSFSTAEDFLDNFKGTWGAGLSHLEGNYKNSDTETTLSPYIFGSFGKLQIEANRVHYPLYTTPSYSILGTGNYRTQQYSDELNLDKSIELGFTVDVPLTHGFNSRLTVLGDISDKHNGTEIDAQLYRHDSIGNLTFLTALAVQYQNDDLANYYYSTNNYTPNDGYVFEAEVIASYPINNVSFFTGLRSYWYGSNISNSPLSDSSNTLLGFTGVGYKF